MNTQPEALRLATVLQTSGWQPTQQEFLEAAAELRRLQDISTDDACAEGALVPPYTDQFAKVHAVKMFRSIWSGINGEELWDANPWVWVVEFQRVQGGV